jgi:DNA-binding NtrC family response regulator
MRDSTQTFAERAVLPAPRPVRLRVVRGPDCGRELLLDGAAALLGSGRDCTLVLTDPTVSLLHARLCVVDGHLRVQDLGSRSGTRYLGARIRDALVPPGSTLELGGTSVALLPTTPPPEPLSPREELEGMVGRSQSMRRLFARVERVARTQTTVLIQGETGVGKELVALALHRLSERARTPFCVIDCCTMSPELMQSQLFGHARGAFTGASRDVKGAVERVRGGTLFLDEVGELPLALQPLLLRVLDTRTFSRAGEDRVRGADFRLVAATHQDLKSLVSAGRFREDLYYRLSATTLTVPPLRERMEDIPLLAEALAREATGRPSSLCAATLASLCAYSWPGNVRELRNTVERVLALGPGALPGSPSGGAPPDFHRARELALQSFERSYLDALLRRHGSAAAAMTAAGLSRSHFFERLKAHGLNRARRKGTRPPPGD